MEMSPWLLCQFAALAASSWLFFRTTRGVSYALRRAFVRALPFTVVGALVVDYALRLVGFALAGARGPLPLFGGIMAYGALFGLAGAYLLFARGSGIGAYRALDRLTAPMALLVAIGRLGCVIAGCEHGRPTGGAWGISYPHDHPHFALFVHDGVASAGAERTLPLHPATLYEAAFALAACGLALALLPRRATKPGGVFFAGTLVYAGGRIVSELFRGDSLRGDHGGAFTTGQAMSVFAIGLAFSLALRETEDRGGPSLTSTADAEPSPTSDTGDANDASDVSGVKPRPSPRGGDRNQRRARWDGARALLAGAR